MLLQLEVQFKLHIYLRIHKFWLQSNKFLIALGFRGIKDAMEEILQKQLIMFWLVNLCQRLKAIPMKPLIKLAQRQAQI